MTETDSIPRLLHEAGQLKRTPRAGWLLAGVPTPDSVAEHSYRVGIIAYVIATRRARMPTARRRSACSTASPRPAPATCPRSASRT